MISNSRSYFPNLDGLRFFAFLHVFITHAFIESASLYSATFRTIKQYLAPGFFGIDMFFVLSGFLITWTLLEEQLNNNRISLKNFFARRSLRIWPLYYLVVITGFTLHYFASRTSFSPEPLPEPYWFIFFILNFYVSMHGPNFMFFLVFMWSVAVEEQFYILWGLVMKYLRRFFPHVCIILILSSLYFRYANLGNSNMLVFHSLGVASNLASGALFAWACFYRSELFRTLHTFPRSTWARIYILIFVIYLLYSKLFVAPAAIVLEKLIFSALFCLVLFDQCFNTGRIFNAGRNERIRYLGRISYGLYCFHGLVITFVLYMMKQSMIPESGIFVFLINPLVIALGTFTIAHFSYRYFEKPFLNLKKSFY